MVTDMITVKLEDTFLAEIDAVVEKEGYQNRTEFIRNALREKVDAEKLKEAMFAISSMKGASRKKTTDEELDRVRARVFAEFDKKLR